MEKLNFFSQDSRDLEFFKSPRFLSNKFWQTDQKLIFFQMKTQILSNPVIYKKDYSIYLYHNRNHSRDAKYGSAKFAPPLKNKKI
jgi:hypothetical protein